MKSTWWALALCSLAATSFAQTSTPDGPDPLWQPMPYRQSAWFDPNRSGSGWFMGDLELDGLPSLQVISMYAYTPTGQPYWLLTTGNTVQSSLEILHEQGVLATYTAQLLESSGGPCPTCAFRPNTVVPSPYGNVTIRYTSAIKGELTINGLPAGTIMPSDLALIPLQDRIEGVWEGDTRRDGSSSGWSLLGPACELDVRRINDPAPEHLYERIDATVRELPPSNALWYSFKKIGGRCIQDSGMGDSYFMTLNPDTLAMRVWYLNPNDNGIFSGISPITGQPTGLRGFRIGATREFFFVEMTGPKEISVRYGFNKSNPGGFEDFGGNYVDNRHRAEGRYYKVGD